MRPRAHAIVVFAMLLTMAVPAGAAVWTFTKIKPTSGPWGTVVRLYGRHFDKKKVKVYYDSRPIPVLKVTPFYLVVKVPEGAKTGWFEVEQDGRRLLAPTKFVVRNVPEIREVVPPKGFAGGWVTLKGRFLKGAKAFMLGLLRLNVKVISDSEVQVFVPRGARSGTFRILYEGRTLRTRVRYVVVPEPQIRGASPSEAWAGDTVVLRGRNICSGPSVTVAGIGAKVVRSSSTSITIRIPEGVREGAGAVSLTCQGRTFTFGSVLTLRPRYAEITSIKPNPAAPGEWIHLRGRNFTPSDRFWIGNVEVKEKRFVSPTLFTIRVPKEVTPGMVHVQSHGKRFPSELVLKIAYPIEIIDVSPKSAWYDQWVSVRTRHLCATPVVRMGGRMATYRIERFGELIHVRVPRGIKRGDLTIKCGRFTARSSVTIAVPSVTITSLSPATVLPGDRVVLRGANFPRKVRLVAGRRHTLLIKRVLDDTIVFLAPSRPGKVTLYLYAYGKGWRVPFQLTVREPNPVLTSVPKKAHFGGEVVLRGRELCGHPRVVMKAGRRTLHPRVLEATPTSIRLLLPKRVPGTRVNVTTITVWCGAKKHVWHGSMELSIPIGNVERLDPPEGPAGTWVLLVGRGIPRSAVFYFGSRQAEVRRERGRIFLKVPEDASGTLPVFISIGRGPRQRTGLSFTVRYPKPSITAISRDYGWTGDRLSIHGASFCARPKVRIGGVSARVLSVTPVRIDVEVPKGVRRGRVTVSCRGGVATGPVFTPVPPYARITSVSRKYACPGDRVLVLGVNFDKGVVFYLGDKRVQARIISPTKAEIVLPRGIRSSIVAVESFGKRIPSAQAIIVKRRYCQGRRRRRR